MSETPQLVAPNGKPIRHEVIMACPRCRAAESKRVPSGGFGELHDVCGVCGYEFEEFTCQS